MTNNNRKINHTLSDTKKKVQDAFLGKYGIHGVGIKQSNNTVRIYIAEESEDLKASMESLASMCSPFSLELIVEEEPKAHPTN
jgi:hypothetical protein